MVNVNENKEKAVQPITSIQLQEDPESLAELKYYLLGGAGIFMGLDLKTYAKTRLNKQAEFVGIDTSNANGSNGLFPIEQMEGVHGSGKDIAMNYPQAEAFIDLVMSRHKPKVFNVILFSSSGGTGSIFAVVLARWFLKRDIPFVMAVAEDHTSETEFKNVVNITRSLVAQTTSEYFGKPINLIRVINANDKTRGQINMEMVRSLDYLSLFLTETNEELDRQDIIHLLDYTKTTKVPATLTEMDFHDGESAADYQGKAPVAVCSLFDHRNNVIPRFNGSAYRATGVMNHNNNFPEDVKELHLTLHHGNLVEQLESQMENLNDRKINTQHTFVDKNQSVTKGSSDNKGVFFD